MLLVREGVGRIMKQPELCDDCLTYVTEESEGEPAQNFDGEAYSSTVTKRCPDGIKRQYTLHWVPCREHRTIFFRTVVLTLPANDVLEATRRARGQR